MQQSMFSGPRGVSVPDLRDRRSFFSRGCPRQARRLLALAAMVGLVGLAGVTTSNAEDAAAELEGVHYYVSVIGSGNVSFSFSAGSFVEQEGYHSGLYVWDAPGDASVTVTATAAPGWTFDGWQSWADEEARASEPCAGTGTCTLEVQVPASAAECLGYCPYFIRARAVTRPSTQSAGVLLASIAFPDDTPRPEISVMGSSDDGRYVLYRHRTPTEEGAGDPTVLRRLDRVAGTEVVVASDPNNFDLWASMSGDGRFVVFDESQEEGALRVRLWDANTDSATTVGDGSRPSVSATGRFISWSRADLAEPVIRVLDRTTTNSVDLPYDGSFAVFSGDESSVAVGITTYDPLTGAVLHTLADSADTPGPLYKLSNDGRHGIGLTDGGRVYLADLVADSIVVSPRVGSGEGDCGGKSMALSSDAKYAYVVSAGFSGNFEIPGGPLVGAAFDYYGRYRIDFTTSPPSLSSATGIISPFGSAGGCGGIAGTADGANLIFGSAVAVPVGVIDVGPSAASVAASTSDGIIVATRRQGTVLPPTGSWSNSQVWLAAVLVAVGAAIIASQRLRRSPR